MAVLLDGLTGRLKIATASHHADLEESLDLLAPPLERERFVALLRGFLGFHAVWEPAVAALIDDEAFLAPRRRFHLIGRDLAGLGAPADSLDGLPLCAAAGDLADPFEAWGSVYVMEGSTLGGRHISHALAGQPWLPAGGLSYFNPHGLETGALWREVRTRLDELPVSAGDRVVLGACRTFERLKRWLRVTGSRATPS